MSILLDLLLAYVVAVAVIGSLYVWVIGPRPSGTISFRGRERQLRSSMALWLWATMILLVVIPSLLLHVLLRLTGRRGFVRPDSYELNRDGFQRRT